uniref:Uncharacterized protein n=1 Tax=Romanomermis culicivorax TaxID=13658 RepID=A0A915HVV0_ROMCU
KTFDHLKKFNREQYILPNISVNDLLTDGAFDHFVFDLAVTNFVDLILFIRCIRDLVIGEVDIDRFQTIISGLLWE